MKVKENENGITIIILVVTIIIMLILAGVTINIAMGEDKDGLIYEMKNQTDEQQQIIQDQKNKINTVIRDFENEWGIN